MHLKRYRGLTVRDALAVARQALGPDALVLSTRLVPMAGWRGWLGTREVEVAIAADRDVSADRPKARQIRQAPPRPAGCDEVIARLCASGLDRALATEIAHALPGSQRRAPSVSGLRRALVDGLGDLAAGEEAPAAVEVFIGPPGGGKTTTIAKIAAQERALRGTRLGLIAADGFRVGAVEQLRLYADIIGTSFAVARTPADLERAISGSRPPVLVDTAGRSPKDGGVRELFEALPAGDGVRTHVVLPAGTAARAAERILDGYAAGRPSRVVLTKLDETETFGPLLGLLRARRLPISYIGTGQRIPEDLERATAPFLASCLLGETSGVEGNPA